MAKDKGKKKKKQELSSDYSSSSLSDSDSDEVETVVKKKGKDAKNKKKQSNSDSEKKEKIEERKKKENIKKIVFEINSKNIAESECEGIVNSIDKQFNVQGGACRAIIKKYFTEDEEKDNGDDSDEVIDKNNKQTNVKEKVDPSQEYVMMIKTQSSKMETLLENLVKNICIQANESELKSIAFYPIGTGILNTPVEVCASAMGKGFRDFIDYDNEWIEKIEICIYEGEESESGSLKYEFENIWRDPNKEETEAPDYSEDETEEQIRKKYANRKNQRRNTSSDEDEKEEEKDEEEIEEKEKEEKEEKEEKAKAKEKEKRKGKGKGKGK